MKKMDIKTLNIIAETHYIRFIASYGLKDAKRLVSLIKKKLLTEEKRRKNEKI